MIDTKGHTTNQFSFTEKCQQQKTKKMFHKFDLKDDRRGITMKNHHVQLAALI